MIESRRSSVNIMRARIRARDLYRLHALRPHVNHTVLVLKTAFYQQNWELSLCSTALTALNVKVQCKGQIPDRSFRK
jgi:hypothetical protein